MSYGFIHRGVIHLWKTNTDISKGIGIYNIDEIDSEYWKSLYSGNDLQNVGDFTLCMFHWNPGSVAIMNIVKFGVGFLMSARSSFLAYVTVWTVILIYIKYKIYYDLFEFDSIRKKYNLFHHLCYFSTCIASS